MHQIWLYVIRWYWETYSDVYYELVNESLSDDVFITLRFYDHSCSFGHFDIVNRQSQLPSSFIKNTSENAKEGFQFRWLKIKGNATAYYILITLFVNHLNWKFRNRSALENYDWSNPRKTIQSLINFYKLNFTWSLLIKSLFSKIWLFSKIGL